MYKFLRIMNLTLCEFTKPTTSRAHLTLKRARFESGAPFIGMPLENNGTVLGSLNQSNIVTFQPFHRPSIFSFVLRIGKRANKNKESGGRGTGHYLLPGVGEDFRGDHLSFGRTKGGISRN